MIKLMRRERITSIVLTALGWVVCVDGTFCVQAALAARVQVARVYRKTVATSVAMVLIDSEPLTHATDATPVAMVHLLPLGVIKKLARATKVPANLATSAARAAPCLKHDAARAAIVGDGLVLVVAGDAGDQLCSVAVDFVVLIVIEAASARVVLAAASGFEPAVARSFRSTWKRPCRRSGGWGGGCGRVRG